MTGKPKPPCGDEIPVVGEGEGGLASRWSARKADVARLEAAEADADAARLRVEADRAAREEQQAANREVAEAVDIGKADYQTDFTPFLKDGVPPALRRQALKALWRTNPILANVDGLNDYDEDFRAAGGAFEAVKSAWEVGRGYAGKADEVTREMAARDKTVEDAVAAERAEVEESELTKDSREQAPDDTAANDSAPDPAEAESDAAAGDEGVSEPEDSVEAVEYGAFPGAAAPCSSRASLRHRLLNNKD